MTLDFSRCLLPPFQHQREDVAWLLEHPFAFIASEMRTGKSKTVIDAAQFLFEQGKIDRVIVVSPAPVRDVWADETLGEISKHAFVPVFVTEYHARIRSWHRCTAASPALHWFITNFEFLRSKERIKELSTLCNQKTLLIGDESSFLKNWSAQQTKAFVILRKRCGWCWLLNGTPVFHSPKDLYSQGNILHPSVLDCPYITLFNARYAIQQPILERGKPMIRYGKIVQEVCGWTNLDDLERRFKPYTIRRLQKDCLDLPPKLDPVTLTATLNNKTWQAYKEMRDDMVVWLSESKVSMSGTAAIKALRLAQITGGFLGGAEEAGIDAEGPTIDATQIVDELSLGPDTLWDIGELDDRSRPRSLAGDIDWDATTERYAEKDTQRTEGHQRLNPNRSSEAVEVGREKLDVLLWLIEKLLQSDPNLHLVAWCRFRAELFRMAFEVGAKFPQFQTGLILGGQRKADRLAALSLLKPETSPEGPVFVAGIEGTGSFGLDMTASHICVTVSSGYSPGRSAQTLDRVYGPGQTHPIAYYNIIAEGPRGQKTIDHDILLARMTGENVAMRTASAWVKALKGVE